MKDEQQIRARIDAHRLVQHDQDCSLDEQDMSAVLAAELEWVLDDGEIVDPKQTNLSSQQPEEDIRW